jgi:hypothetical protein
MDRPAKKNSENSAFAKASGYKGTAAKSHAGRRQATCPHRVIGRSANRK